MGLELWKKEGWEVFRLVPEDGRVWLWGFRSRPLDVNKLEKFRSMDDALDAYPEVEIQPPLCRLSGTVGGEDDD